MPSDIEVNHEGVYRNVIANHRQDSDGRAAWGIVEVKTFTPENVDVFGVDVWFVAAVRVIACPAGDEPVECGVPCLLGTGEVLHEWQNGDTVFTAGGSERERVGVGRLFFIFTQGGYKTEIFGVGCQSGKRGGGSVSDNDLLKLCGTVAGRFVVYFPRGGNAVFLPMNGNLIGENLIGSQTGGTGARITCDGDVIYGCRGILVDVAIVFPIEDNFFWWCRKRWGVTNRHVPNCCSR